jgi:superfamily I DNA and/or RNA helicase
VLRLGHPVRVSEQLQNLTLDAQFEEHEQYPIMQRLRREAQEKLHRATKQRRSYRSKQERAQDFKEMGKMKNQARELEQQILDDVVREAQVICCTPVGSTQQVLDNLRFKTVFMDEAAQSMTPASLIPLCKAERVIFAGDHCQLPPTVKSREAGQQGLDESLFEKFYRRQLGQFGLRAGRMLQTQYRMHEAIMAFSNAWFYNGELMADESVRTHTLLPPGTDERASQPFELIDTSGCGYEEQQNPETLSRYNTGEARLLLKRVAGLLADLSDYVDTTYTVGILAPYRAQVATLDELFENEFPLALTKQHRIEIDTIDAFQGQERDIIAIGLTRSNAKAQIGFLSDRRRMNVALTRARQKLILAGDATTVTSDNFFQALFDHAEATGAYLHAWELPEVTAEV